MRLNLDIHSDHYQFLIKVFATTVMIVGDVDSWQARLRADLLAQADLLSLGLGVSEFPTARLDQPKHWLAVYQGMCSLNALIQSIADDAPLSLLPVLGFGHWADGSITGIKQSAKRLKQAFLKPEYFPDLKGQWLQLLQQYPSMVCRSCCGQTIKLNPELTVFYAEDGSAIEWFDILYAEVSEYLVDPEHLTGFEYQQVMNAYSIRSQNLIL